MASQPVTPVRERGGGGRERGVIRSSLHISERIFGMYLCPSHTLDILEHRLMFLLELEFGWGCMQEYSNVIVRDRREGYARIAVTIARESLSRYHCYTNPVIRDPTNTNLAPFIHRGHRYDIT